jgi:DNA-binding GntR family transcriptional regulator
MKLRKHKTLREQIVFSLRESIIRGELKPGTKLTEPELATRLGISRTPIRESFRQLESEGFLTVIPRKGAVVSNITRKDIEDFFELKSLLEGYAARVAAEKMTEKDVDKLIQINKELADCAENNNYERFFTKNEEFHNYFLTLCGNEKLVEIRDTMVKRFLGFRMAALSMPGRLMESVKQHEQAIKAFKRGDGRLAEAVLVEHALLGGDYLAEQVDRASREQEAAKERS